MQRKPLDNEFHKQDVNIYQLQWADILTLHWRIKTENFREIETNYLE